MGGVLIGDKHTENDWGLIWTDVEITAPEEQRLYVPIRGMDGELDLTEAFGNVIKYGNRTVKNSFLMLDRSLAVWNQMYSEIQNYCHGKEMKVTLDSDRGFYYTGRISVSSKKEDGVHSSVVISCNAKPYKFETTSSLERWKWNALNFLTGRIRNYSNILVNGSKTVKIVGRKMIVIPEITSSSVMNVSYNGKTFGLMIGKNKFYDLALLEGENILVFTGNGTVSIDYRGGSL